MGLLDGDLADKVFAAFDGKLLSGTIRQHNIPLSGALDSYGDPIDLGASDTAMQGFIDSEMRYFKGERIPETDVVVNIFAKSCDGLQPGKDDQVSFTRGSDVSYYQLREVDVDPAVAMWVCRAFEIEALS